jgi:phosphate starvation-inducible protein PhoH and related proteins
VSRSSSAYSTNLFFEDHTLLTALYGEQDTHLKKLEKLLHVEAMARGNMLTLTGAQRDVVLVEEILMDFYNRLKRGEDVGAQELEAAVRMAPPVVDADLDTTPGKGKKRNMRRAIRSDVYIKTMRKTVEPYSHMQANYIRSLYDHDMVFALGPAGTGKTFIAVAMGVYMIMTNRVERIILSRPAVEAGEKLGFLPGNLKEKIDPYLRPLYDALFDMMPADKVNHMMETGAIEVAPLAFMRGRTLSNAFIILDEAQNTTSTQMKMFLTRLGENSRMVITGDMSQIDLPKDIKSGLYDSLRKISHIEGISVVSFSDMDVVRHELVSKIVLAYDDWDKGVRPGPSVTEEDHTASHHEVASGQDSE